MLPRTLDRPTVRLMAIKRLISGTLSVALGIGAKSSASDATATTDETAG